MGRWLFIAGGAILKSCRKWGQHFAVMAKSGYSFHFCVLTARFTL